MTYDDYLERQIKRHTDAPQMWEPLYENADFMLPEVNTKQDAIYHLSQIIEEAENLIDAIEEAE